MGHAFNIQSLTSATNIHCTVCTSTQFITHKAEGGTHTSIVREEYSYWWYSYTQTVYTGKMAHAHSGPGTLRCASHRGQRPSHERQNGLQKARREHGREGGKVGEGTLEDRKA